MATQDWVEPKQHIKAPRLSNFEVSFDRIDDIVKSGFLDGNTNTVPEGITVMDWKKTIQNKEKLTSIVIPEGVTEIGEYAFRGCESLTSVVIPKNCKLRQHAFSGSTKVLRRVCAQSPRVHKSWGFSIIFKAVALLGKPRLFSSTN